MIRIGHWLRQQTLGKVLPVVLTAVLMFLAAELLAQDKGDSTDTVANPAADRREISKGLQQNVAKLDELIKLLKSGEAKVQVIDKQDKDKKD